MKLIDNKIATHLLEQYFFGKDNDDQKILSKIFAKNSKVIFDIETPMIDFPNVIEGNSKIAETMFSSFHKNFQHVKSYYLIKSREINIVNNMITRLPWLVVMQEKETGNSRIGIGHYDILFTYDEDGTWLINEFGIKIAEMQSIADNELYNTFQLTLSYPWCSATSLDKILSPYNALLPVHEILLGYGVSEYN